MMERTEGLSGEQRRQAFGWWLRTGLLPQVRSADGLELKFNPYHDPFNGQFTFAPGGRDRVHERATRRVDAHGNGSSGLTRVAVSRDTVALGGSASSIFGSDNRSDPAAMLNLAPPPGPNFGRGSNSRAFEDPMTLERAFPGLEHAPGGAIIAVADNLLDFRGPGAAAQIEVIDN